MHFEMIILYDFHNLGDYTSSFVAFKISRPGLMSKMTVLIMISVSSSTFWLCKYNIVTGVDAT